MSATIVFGDQASVVPERFTIAGRYRFVRELGAGGFGKVDCYEDLVLGDHVAIKWLPAASQLDLTRARREVTALRWLRLPGVVQLRDEGTWTGMLPNTARLRSQPTSWEGGWFIVTELVEGTPFPTARTPWSALKKLAVGLLEVLAGIHNFGIVHGDLKPANVMIRKDGRVVVLDLGTATGRAMPLNEGRIIGTPIYMAPERYAVDGYTARADLYAVGHMLRDALTGDPKRRTPLPADVPPEVVTLLSRLLEENPADRLESAEAAIALLGLPLPELTPKGVAVLSIEQLQGLFGGPAAFDHTPEDAAELLLARTGGDAARVNVELERWLHTGIAWRENGRICLDRLGLDRLTMHSEEEVLRRLLRLNAPPAEIVAEATRLASYWQREGQPSRAIAALQVGLDFARAEHLIAEEEALLTLWCAATFAQETRAAVNRALVEFGRCTELTPAIWAMEELLRATEAVQSDQGTLAGEKARQHLDGLEPFANEDLEIWRQGVGVRAARHLGNEEDALIRLESWAITPGRRARWLGWLGNLRYQQGRYAEAARHHMASLEGRTGRTRRIAALLGAATSMMEVPELIQARAIASVIVEEARECRQPLFEALATWIVRTATYRLDEPITPRPDLVDAAARVGRRAEAMFALNEAAVAWRQRQNALAQPLAERGARAFTAVDQPEAALLCRALHAAASRPLPAEGLPRVLAQEAMMCKNADLSAEILALVRLAADKPDPSWTQRAMEKALYKDVSFWNNRLDVLSLAEAVNPAWDLPE